MNKNKEEKKIKKDFFTKKILLLTPIYFFFILIILFIRKAEVLSKQKSCLKNYVFDEICYNLKVLDFFYIMIFAVLTCSILFIKKKDLNILNFFLNLNILMMICLFIFSNYADSFFIGHINIYNLDISIILIKFSIIIFSLILMIRKNINE